jgi:hypothetical protein
MLNVKPNPLKKAFEKIGIQVAYLAVGYCPCERSGHHYDTEVLEVVLKTEQKHLLDGKWFSPSTEFPEYKEWHDKQDNFYFPNGKNNSRQWSEDQWELFADKASAQRKANMWAENDVSEEMAASGFIDGETQ